MPTKKPESDVVVCPKCGEDASGPGAEEAMKRHMAKKHGAKKK